jgi:hypothetical protein
VFPFVESVQIPSAWSKPPGHPIPQKKAFSTKIPTRDAYVKQTFPPPPPVSERETILLKSAPRYSKEDDLCRFHQTAEDASALPSPSPRRQQQNLTFLAKNARRNQYEDKLVLLPLLCIPFLLVFASAFLRCIARACGLSAPWSQSIASVYHTFDKP